MFDEILIGLAAIATLIGGYFVYRAQTGGVTTTGNPVGSIGFGSQVQPENPRMVERTSWEALNAKADDWEVLARTIYGEARSESVKGREAVATVILNRKKDRRWPNSVKSVCLQDKQFSCWNANDPNRDWALSADRWDRAYMDCIEIAESALSGQIDGNLDGANHYHTDGVTPYWSKSMNQVASIGAHKFFVG